MFLRDLSKDDYYVKMMFNIFKKMVPSYLGCRFWTPVAVFDERCPCNGLLQPQVQSRD